MSTVNRQVGELVAGKYKLERQLGEGGMGVVFAALHMGTGRRVALKCMAPAANAITANARFKREAQAAGRIDHPNVVQVFDVGEDARGRFIVMEFLKGEALGDVLHQRRLPPADAIDLLMPAFRGVHAAHRQGIVHRDLKPDNIFVCRNEDGAVQIKVLDFGVSKLTLDAENEDLTRTGVLLGTPQYMAPERVRGQGDSDKRSDVYALGVILYEALTGHRPFDGEHLPEVVARITRDRPQRLRDFAPELPETLEAVVLKAMAPSPQDRYQDVESFAIALEPFAGDERFIVRRRDPTQGLLLDAASPLAARQIPATQTRRIASASWSDRRLIASASALALIGVLVAVGWVLATRPEAEQRAGTLRAPEPATSALARVAPVPPPSAPPVQPEAASPPASQPGLEPSTVPGAAVSATQQARPQPIQPRSKAAPAPRRRNAATSAPTQPAPREGTRPRVARGVRTGGLSEQDF